MHGYAKSWKKLTIHHHNAALAGHEDGKCEDNGKRNQLRSREETHEAPLSVAPHHLEEEAQHRVAEEEEDHEVPLHLAHPQHSKNDGDNDKGQTFHDW